MNDNTWYQRIAAAILEMKTVCWDTDPNGYPSIQYVIADHMLQHLSVYDRHQHLDSTVAKVKNLLAMSISHLQENGHTVYITKVQGGRNINMITLNAEDLKAKEKDEARIRRNMFNAISAGTAQMKAKHPDSLNMLPHVKLSLPELAEGTA